VRRTTYNSEQPGTTVRIHVNSERFDCSTDHAVSGHNKTLGYIWERLGTRLEGPLFSFPEEWECSAECCTLSFCFGGENTPRYF